VPAKATSWSKRVIIIVTMLSWCALPSCADNSQAANRGTIRPEIESVSPTVAFVRWIVPNPGGTILHYAIVQYGKSPKHLEWTTKCPTRINPAQSQMTFRARVGGLEPDTTYYFRVYSMQANGISDSEPSAIGVFTTQGTDSLTLNH
jgi:Purple acid Phosphatase, N-terminal domain